MWLNITNWISMYWYVNFLTFPFSFVIGWICLSITLCHLPFWSFQGESSPHTLILLFPHHFVPHETFSSHVYFSLLPPLSFMARVTRAGPSLYLENWNLRKLFGQHYLPYLMRLWILLVLLLYHLKILFQKEEGNWNTLRCRKKWSRLKIGCSLLHIVSSIRAFIYS